MRFSHLLRFVSCFTFGLFLCISTPAQSGAELSPGALTNLVNLSFEELLDIRVDSVYAASRYEQKVTRAPSAVSIVTADEIQKFGHRTLAEVLQSVRGVYVSYDRNYAYVGMRGFNRPGDYSSRVLILVDGHRINDNIYDSGFIGTDFPVDVDLIERVEVIRGPGSSLYGSNAFLGVVNVVTKTGAGIKGMEVSGEWASYDTYKGRFSFGEAFESGVELLVSGSYYDSHGPRRLYFKEYDNPAENFGRAMSRDGEHYYNLFAALRYRDITLQAVYSEREKEIPTGSYGTIFNDSRAQTVDARHYVTLKFDRELTEDARLMARISYDVYRYCGDYPYLDPTSTLTPAPSYVNQDVAAGDWLGTDVQFTQKLWDRLTLNVGGELRANLRQDQRNMDLNPDVVYVDDRRRSEIWGLYGEAELAIRTNLLLNAGLRLDAYESFGTSLNPRLGLIFNPAPRTTLKLLYGTAFRAPNVYELYYAADTQVANPGLDPETIHTYELVLEQYFRRDLRFSISGFYYKLEDLISQTAVPGGLMFENMDEARAQGVELELEKRWENGALARVSHTVQDAEDQATGAWLSNSPRQLSRLNVSVPIFRSRVFTGVELLYSGRTRTVVGTEAEDHLIANWTFFGRELVPGLQASATLYNVFDTRYGNPGAGEHLQDVIFQNGRTFRVKLTYRF